MPKPRWEIHASKTIRIFLLLSLQDYTYILNKDEGGSLENTINLNGIPKAMGCCVLGTLQKKTAKPQTQMIREGKDGDLGVAMLD